MQSVKHIVTIPEPCSENWAEMTPVEQGRFCASCQKTVVDLSCRTDQEVIDFFKWTAGASPCVRFHSSQIGRELTEVKAQSFSFRLLKRIAASLILFQSIVTTAWAQKVKTPTTQHANKVSDKEDKNRKIVKGAVIDQATGQMLGGVIVSVAGTEFKTTTCKDGSFRIELPDNFAAASVTVTAASGNGAGSQATIIDVVVPWDDVAKGRNVVLCRYPNDRLPPVFDQPQETFSGRGLHRQVTFVVKQHSEKTPWQKMTAPLRKKKAN